MATSTKTTAKKSVAPTKKAAEQAAAPAKAVAKKAAKPAAAKPVVAKTAAPKARKAAASGKPAVSAEQRLNYVEVAAYFIAERNGFVPGCELENWAAAEAEIDRLLAAGLLNT